MVLACKTDPEAGAKGVSLIVVETSREGFQRGRRLEKLGLKAQDTSELFFNDVRVPVANRLGEEGAGFKMAMHKLAHERLIIAVNAVATCEAVLEWTVQLHAGAQGVRQADRRVPEHALQGGGAHRAGAGRARLRRPLHRARGRQPLDSTDAAMAKMVTSELQCRVVDECLQFFGGYGYTLDYPIAHAYIDARVRRIAGGSSEVMREIVSRKIFQG